MWSGGVTFVAGKEIVERVADLLAAPIEMAAHPIKESVHAFAERWSAVALVPLPGLFVALFGPRTAIHYDRRMVGGRLICRRLRSRRRSADHFLRTFHESFGAEDLAGRCREIQRGGTLAAVVHEADFPNRLPSPCACAEGVVCVVVCEADFLRLSFGDLVRAVAVEIELAHV